MKRTREDLAPHTPSVLLVTRFPASGDGAAKKERAGEKQRDVHMQALNLYIWRPMKGCRGVARLG